MPETQKNQEGQEVRSQALGNILADPHSRELFLNMAPYWHGAGVTLAHKLRQRYEGAGGATLSVNDEGVWTEGAEATQDVQFSNVEIMLLREWRAEYLRRMEMVDRAQKLCTPDVVSDIASQNETLGALLDLMEHESSAKQGLGVMHGLIASQIEGLAFSDNLAHFEDFVATLQGVAAMEEEEKSMTDQIQANLQKHGISLEQYRAVIDTGNRQLQQELLYKVVSDQKGLIGRLRQSRNFDAALDLLNAETNLQELQAQTDMQLGQLGELFSILTKGHDVIRRQLSDAILEEQPADGRRAERSEAGEDALFRQEFSNLQTQAPALRNYDTLWERTRQESHYDTLGYPEQQQVRERFLDAQFAHRPKRGLWQATKALFKDVWSGNF